jgi:cobaltochelatase CobT
MDWGGYCQMAAITTDVLGEALERIGIPTEIIGFYSRYLRDDQIPPGFAERLRARAEAENKSINSGFFQYCADLVICKRFEKPWRQARPSMGIHLHTEHFGGTPEGEALLFAHRRIQMRPEKKKIILVIGDGDANNKALLHNTIREISSTSDTHLAAVKIGARRGVIYPATITLKDASELCSALVRELVVQLNPYHEAMRKAPKAQQPKAQTPKAA